MFTKNVLKSFFSSFNVMWYDENYIDKFLSQLYSDYNLYSFFYSKENFVKLITKYKNYNIVGDIKLNSELKNDIIIDTEPTKMFIITNAENNALYLSIGCVAPQLWYKIDDISNNQCIFDIIKIYDPKSYCSTKTLKYTIQHESDSLIDDIYNYFVINVFTEVLVYGSKWEDYPFRSQLCEYIIGIKQFNKMNICAIEQSKNKCSISTHTVNSKSLISIEECNNICSDENMTNSTNTTGSSNNNNLHKYVLKISYNPIYNKKIDQINFIKKTKFPNDIPIDLFMSLLKFPFANW